MRVTSRSSAAALQCPSSRAWQHVCVYVYVCMNVCMYFEVRMYENQRETQPRQPGDHHPGQRARWGGLHISLGPKARSALSLDARFLPRREMLPNGGRVITVAALRLPGQPEHK